MLTVQEICLWILLVYAYNNKHVFIHNIDMNYRISGLETETVGYQLCWRGGLGLWKLEPSGILMMRGGGGS